MVKTRVQLKVKLREWIREQEQPFKTADAVEYSQEIAPHINLHPNRIANYIRSSREAEYSQKDRKWRVKTIPKKLKRRD